MSTGTSQRASNTATLTKAEAVEARSLLDVLPQSSPGIRRTTDARLRRLGLDPATRASLDGFDVAVAGGLVLIDDARAWASRIVRQRPGMVFRVSVGVTGHSVGADWDAFDQRYQWFGKKPQQVTSGAHLFVLAVDRWSSACVGLYEAVSAGAESLPGSPDPKRWPYALGVKPLAAVPPPDAVRVDGQRGPQSGLPERIIDTEAIDALYTAVSGSSLPPGPSTVEQRVHELDAEDLGDDVLRAVRDLGNAATHPAVIERAVELVGWSQEELGVRAWYTGSGTQSHVRRVLSKALDRERLITGRITRLHGSRYVLTDDDLGVKYRPAADRMSPTTPEQATVVDIAALEKATKRHMRLQDTLAAALADRGLDARSPASGDPQFDLAFQFGGTTFVVEVKSGDPVAPQQARLGCGQVLEYCHVVQESYGGEVRAVLMFEHEPPPPWSELTAKLDIALVIANDLHASLRLLLDS